MGGGTAPLSIGGEWEQGGRRSGGRERAGSLPPVRSRRYRPLPTPLAPDRGRERVGSGSVAGRRVGGSVAAGR